MNARVRGHVPVPRHTAWRGIALLKEGFRPFFLVAGLAAMIAIPVWLGMLAGAFLLPSVFDPLTWHVHEMLFGFVYAAIAGFLLTAIPNWTGRLPLQGWPLAGLVLLWIAGRIAVAISAWTGPLAAALIDLALPVVLLAVVVREIVAGRNWRNLPVMAGLGALLFANALFHVEALGWGWTAVYGERLAIAVVVLLIGLIGGRIVPSFTRNWLVKRGDEDLPASFGPYDKATLLMTIAWGAVWTTVPGSFAAATLAGIAAVMHLARLARWRGPATGQEPLLAVLHLGYLWLPVGLGLLALAGPWALAAPTVGIHALATGAFATMILAVMTRASLGHTGRPLAADTATTLVFALVTLSAVARVIAGLLPEHAMVAQHSSGLAWIVAFALFVVRYLPILSRARPAASSAA